MKGLGLGRIGERKECVMFVWNSAEQGSAATERGRNRLRLK